MSNDKHDPWTVLAPQQGQVPVANYMAVFKGVEEYRMPSTGEVKWRFVWEIATGEHKSKRATALCDRSINPNVLPGRLIGGLLSRTIVPGENVKAAVEACVGKTYMITVANGPKGGKPGVQFVGQPPM